MIDPDIFKDKNFPIEAVIVICQVLEANAHKHAPGSWRQEPASEHLVHVVEHLKHFFNGDTSEPHLSHALTRLAMTISCILMEAQKNEELS